MGRRAHRPPAPSDGTDALLPPVLRERLIHLLGHETDDLEKALARPSPTSIRLNPRKPFDLVAEPVPWCANGRYLAERPAFTLDPLLHAGAYYVQEASSMLIEQALIASDVLQHDVLALDLCAAPGGKSTHLLSLLTEGSLLVANEPDAQRRHVLAENIWKHGAPNVVITGSDPTDLEALAGSFDLVLVDAPCSGEGMFRKDAFARAQWSPQLVAACAATQRRILQHAWNALAPGGTLIYSTCTWEPAENEEQLLPMIAAGGMPIPIALDPAWGVMTTDANGVISHRCYPHRVQGEGFFMAVVRKPGERPMHTSLSTSGTTASSLPWLNKDNDRVLVEHGGVHHAVPAQWATIVQTVSKIMRVHAPGIPFAEAKGGQLAPHPAAALSLALDRNTFPQLALTEEGTLAYLSGASIPASNTSGPALVTHRGLALGWAHGAGNRWNNRWPAPWRIRSQRSQAPRVSWHGQG